MTKHVIVGASIGGLYTAYRLTERIDAANIVIIDPRAGIYTRPGYLNEDAFDCIGKYTGIDTKNHSSANHIKELERIMYRELINNTAVQFVNESFLKLQPETDNQVKAVITRRDDGSEGLYPADFVFDCTGQSGHVAKAVNAYQEQERKEAFFQSKPLVNVIPIPDHLIAHVLIPGASRQQSFDFEENLGFQIVPPRYRYGLKLNTIDAREQLRALGWSYGAFPAFTTSSANDTRDKVCLYMETPPNLPRDQQSAWIKLLLTIYTDGWRSDYTELKPSQKYEKKPRIVAFKQNYHCLNRAIFQSDVLPTVIIGFDALTSSDYRVGDSIESGVHCFNLMLDHFTIQDGKIIGVAIEALEEAVFDYINNKCKPSLIRISNMRQKAIEESNEYFSNVYMEAREELPASESAKSQEYQSLAGELAYKAAKIQFPRLNDGDESALTRLSALNNCLHLLIRAQRYLPASETIAHHDINAKRQSVTTDLRLKMAALKIEDIKNARSYNEIKPLLNSIKENVDQLGGTWAERFIQNKTQELIKKIGQRSNSFFYTRPSLESDKLIAPMFLALIGNGRIPFSGSLFAPTGNPTMDALTSMFFIRVAAAANKDLESDESSTKHSL